MSTKERQFWITLSMYIHQSTNLVLLIFEGNMLDSPTLAMIIVF